MTNWQAINEQTMERAVRIIQKIPFTRAVFLTGSMAEGRANEKSDIDLFVQVKEGRIWSTRFFVTLLIHIAGIRRIDNNIPGKVCLNWFATFNAPAKRKGRVYKQLWLQNQKPETRNLKLVFEQLLSGFLGNAVEKILKKYQIARILRDPRTHEVGSAVRYSDTELGFHPNKAKNLKSRV